SQHPSNRTEGLEPVRDAVAAVATKLGRPLRLLLGKPGLDGHSNGAEQIAARARDCGIEITYDGIRLTPQEIVSAATERQPDVIGLSILSGSHLPLLRETLDLMREAGLTQPLVVGGIIPDEDAKTLKAMGVAQVYTPKDFQLNRIMLDLVALADPAKVAAATPAASARPVTRQGCPRGPAARRGRSGAARIRRAQALPCTMASTPPLYPLLQQTRARRINGAGIFPPSLRKEDAER
ncbi:MAG: cobalamin-dependent protein, partial [Tabrizicola sp.]